MHVLSNTSVSVEDLEVLIQSSLKSQRSIHDVSSIIGMNSKFTELVYESSCLIDILPNERDA
jgi:hypothetical protein